MKRFILICDAAHARLLSAGKRQEPLELKREISNARGRARDQALQSDEPGRLRKGRSGVLSAMDPRTAPHEVEMERFAAELAHVLHEHLSSVAGDSTLTIVPPPHFLGILRAKLTSAVEKRLAAAVPMDLNHLTEHELPQHLEHVLWPGC